MPIYMDRHYLPEEATAEVVAQLHQEDLKIQDDFGCRGLTYWFDGKRKTAFCLIEAPNKKALEQMHDHAHGEVPNLIIEVNAEIVESFLGRIEDPEKSQKTKLNIINDPAFRTIMVAGIKWISLKNFACEELGAMIHNQNNAVLEVINKFNGRLVKQKPNYYLTSFDSVSNAILCALEIQKYFSQTFTKKYESDVALNIGLNAGVPVTETDGIFEDTIKTADRYCNVVKGQLVVSSEVKDLYESENLNVSLDKKLVHTLNPTDEIFLNALIDFTEKEWPNTTLTAEDFSKYLGYSKSQLYRKMVSITGKSPNSFIKEYRLQQAIKLLNKKAENISEIAFETGFNSPAYFSKCFYEAFDLLPSAYVKQHLD